MAQRLNAHSANMNARDSESERRKSRGGSAGDPPLRLLIVDDDPNYRAYVAALTRRLGFVVDQAADGERALDFLAVSTYDVVMIDYEMPRLNGIELITRLRAQARLTETYALMLTGREDLEIKLTALNAGFDDFLTKSHTELELMAKFAAARRIASRQRNLDVAVRELYGLATHDELTGVSNRRFFIAETERMIAERVPLSLILFDLDGFKAVNDTYGHLAGDRVLADVGALFQRNTRSIDLIARLGGDEFIMVVSHLPVDDVRKVAARLAEDVRSLQWMIGSDTFGVGITTGIASSHLLDQPMLEHLLEIADRDLYKNKWVRKHPEDESRLYLYPRTEAVVHPMREPQSAPELPEAAADDAPPPQDRLPR